MSDNQTVASQLRSEINQMWAKLGKTPEEVEDEVREYKLNLHREDAISEMNESFNQQLEHGVYSPVVTHCILGYEGGYSKNNILNWIHNIIEGRILPTDTYLNLMGYWENRGYKVNILKKNEYCFEAYLTVIKSVV